MSGLIHTDTQLGVVLLKPESLPALEFLYNHLARPIARECCPACAKAMRDGIAVLRGKTPASTEVCDWLLYVETGIFGVEFLDLLYRTDASHLDPNVFVSICAEYRGRPYALIVLRENKALSDHNVSHCLAALKGKMSGAHPNEAYGLRGLLLRHTARHMADGDDWRKTGNFLHTADNAAQAQKIFAYALGERSRDENVAVLLDRREVA